MNNLFEAFQALDLLNEDTFELDQKGIAELKEFEDESDKEIPIFDIIDPEAETEEDVKEEYIGDAILQCTVCASMIYKKPEEVVINEEGTLANVTEECPYCQSVEGFKVIGQVAPFVKPSEEVEDKEDEFVEITNKDQAEEVADELSDEVSKEDKDEEDLDEALKTKKGVKKLSSIKNKKLEEKESLDDIDADADDKKEKAKAEEEKADDDADADRDDKKDDLKEDFNKVDIETDTERLSMESDPNGKVTVTTEPKETESAEEADQTIVPVTDEIKAEFKQEEPEETDESDYMDIDIDEFEEDDFDQLGEKYMREVYDNVKSFKTSSVKSNKNTLKLEGVITFKSGKKANTNFIFEASTVSKKGKVKFLGENKQFAKGRKSFTLTGSMNGNKLMMESLTYNYKAKDPKTNESKRLYGTVRVSK